MMTYKMTPTLQTSASGVTFDALCSISGATKVRFIPQIFSIKVTPLVQSISCMTAMFLRMRVIGWPPEMLNPSVTLMCFGLKYLNTMPY